MTLLKNKILTRTHNRYFRYEMNFSEDLKVLIKEAK